MTCIRTSRTMFITGGIAASWSCPRLWRTYRGFSWKVMLLLISYCLSMSRNHFLIPGLLSFHQKSMLNFIKCPLRFYRTFSSFNLPMGYVLLIDFWILKHDHTPGIDLCEIWNFYFQHAMYYLGLFVLWFNDYGLHLDRFQPHLPCSSFTFSERQVWIFFFSLFRLQI